MSNINQNVEKPKIENMVRLPYQSEIFLCPTTQTRWIFDGKELYRDFDGENDWEQMATYVNKTYSQVFTDSYKYASNV